LPNGQWAQAVCLQPACCAVWCGFVLRVYDQRLSAAPGPLYQPIHDVFIAADGTLSATGTLTLRRWTTADLRAADPDEAEHQTYRSLGCCW
jgi:hypothetical protein